MSKDSIQRGDICNIEGKRCRIIEVNSDLIFVIGLDELFIDKYDAENFAKCVFNGTYPIEEGQPQNRMCDLSEKETARIQEWSSVMEELLQNRYPDWESMVQARVKKAYFYQAAERLHTTAKYLRVVFVRYLRSGRDMYSLVDERHFNRVSKKASKALLCTSEQQSELEGQLQEALAEFKRKLSVTAAHHYLLMKYYMTPRYVDGAMRMELLPEEERISYKRVYNYIKRNLGGRTINEYCKGERDFRNNQRPLTGNARTGLRMIGQLFQVDECEVGVTIVSERDPNRVIGKPIMYCAFDPVAQIIVAVTVGLKNNSYSGFCDLMMTLLEPHENQTSLVDVHCTNEQFPSMILPKEIRADHGSEYESKALERAMKELGIKTSLVPVAAGSYKGGVENVFMRLQHVLRNTLLDYGYILPDHDAAKKARQEACLTLKDIRQIIYKLVIDLNMAVLPGYSPDREMMEAGIVLSPMEIWRYELKRSGNPSCITDANRMRILYALLSQDKKFKLSRAGIEYVGHNLRYFIEEEWFYEMIRAKSPEFEVRYDDQCVGAVYVRYKKEIHKVPLATKREELESFADMNWIEYDELYKEMKARQKTGEQESLNRRLNVEQDIRRIAETASLLQGDVANATKHIKVSRQQERKALESGASETRNRLISELSQDADVQVISSVPVIEEKDMVQDEVVSDVKVEDLLNLLGEED